jgi:hypothetical protein
VKKSLFLRHCVWAEQGEHKEAALSPLHGGHWLETQEGYAVNSPLVTVCICREFLRQRYVSHGNLIMGCVVGRFTASGALSVCPL